VVREDYYRTEQHPRYSSIIPPTPTEIKELPYLSFQLKDIINGELTPI